MTLLAHGGDTLTHVSTRLDLMPVRNMGGGLIARLCAWGERRKKFEEADVRRTLRLSCGVRRYSRTSAVLGGHNGRSARVAWLGSVKEGRRDLLGNRRTSAPPLA